jgi:hypothetical protein
MEDATVRETEYGTLCTDLNGSIRACCAISGVKISLRSRVLSFTFYFVVLLPLHRYIQARLKSANLGSILDWCLGLLRIDLARSWLNPG